MKKSLLLTAFLCVASLIFANGAKDAPKAKSGSIHIGVVTGTVSQSEDDLRGAEELI